MIIVKHSLTLRCFYVGLLYCKAIWVCETIRFYISMMNYVFRYYNTFSHYLVFSLCCHPYLCYICNTLSVLWPFPNVSRNLHCSQCHQRFIVLFSRCLFTLHFIYIRHFTHLTHLLSWKQHYCEQNPFQLKLQFHWIQWSQ